MDYGYKPKREINPRDKANIVSERTFFYTIELFRNAFRKDLEENDIYETSDDLKAKELGDLLEHKWKIECTQHSKPSIYRLLWTSFGKTYLFLGFIQFLMKTAMALLLPQAMGKLVAYFVPNQTTLSQNDAIYYASLVVGLSLINSVYVHNYMQILAEMSLRVKTAFSSLIYRKSLKLSPAAISDITMGKIVTLISKDVNNFDVGMVFFNDLWVGVTQLFLVSYLIYDRIGVAAFAGIGFFLAVIPIQIYIGKLTTTLRIKASKLTDERLQTTQETLSAIKIIKMYTWERFFGDKVSTARKYSILICLKALRESFVCKIRVEEEMRRIRKIYHVKFVSLIIGSLVSSIAFYLLIMTYLWLHETITAEIVYFVMGCFHNLRSTVTITIPIGIAQCAELYASLKRIRKVLVAQELSKPKRFSYSPYKPIVDFNNVTVKLKETTILKDITINIKSGLNLLTGPVGSGKSSFLKAILEEYPTYFGGLRVRGSISYASQEPWLFPSTIKQNILFGHVFDLLRYQKVLEVCALNLDIATFDLGDETVVGDRGLNLSKGQQARINLARAVYSNRDIYLLDDCLSALDAHVHEFVFKECIKTFLKNKIVILISHHPNHIKQADNVIILENGFLKSYTKSEEIDDEILNEILDDKDLNLEKTDEIDDKLDEANEETKLITIGKTEPLARNIYHENKKSGKVDWEIYKKYSKYGGGFVLVLVLIGLFLVSQATISYTEKLVSNWVNIEQNISTLKLSNLTNTTDYFESIEEKHNILLIYSIFIIGSTILSLAKAWMHFSFCSRASVNLHKGMIASIMNATMEFFDLNFLGNILNRFSKDLGTIDEYLPFVIFECGRMFLILIGIVALIVSVNLSFLLPSAVLCVILYCLRTVYIPAGRSLKRLDSATRSPVIGYLNATLEGLATIRSHENQSILEEEFDGHQNLSTSAFYMMISASRAFGFIMEMLCSVFIAIIVIKFLFSGTAVLAGNVGLAITQAFMLTGILQWGLRQWAELENQMTSVERVIEYTNIKEEQKNGKIIENWPKEGSIKYEKVHLTYNTSKENILKNINFTIAPKEKIGIVGRTGAGKTSIISTLFRLYDVEGKILIDDVDIKTLSLEFLRSNIAIIPQDPILFSGSIRSNIDPTAQYTDAEIWKAIETVKLKHLISDLKYRITEGGSNFSSGQRQLICLARAIVSKSKIMVLDEATANVDPETDTLIHNTIQKYFEYCTVITIAHRLHSVLNSDRVMVVSDGEIVEFDKPNVLLANKNGIFYKMVKQANLLDNLNK